MKPCMHEYINYTEEIRMSFQKYGAVTIDWPHKIYSKSRVPPKGESASVYQVVCVYGGFHG